MFSEPILRRSHTARQRQINGKEYSDYVVTDNTPLPCSARWTEVSGGQAGDLCLVSAVLEIIDNFSLHFVGSHIVALRL